MRSWRLLAQRALERIDGLADCFDVVLRRFARVVPRCRSVVRELCDAGLGHVTTLVELGHGGIGVLLHFAFGFRGLMLGLEPRGVGFGFRLLGFFRGLCGLPVSLRRSLIASKSAA